MTENEVIVFEGRNVKLSKKQYDTFVSSISTQQPTREEIELHLWYCDSKNVNPLDKLIFFTKRKGRYTPVTSIDFMRIRAESSGSYIGSDDAVFEKDSKGNILSATVTVWKIVQGKNGRFTATARWAEYAPPDLKEPSSFMWRKMPHTMLAKCAEALALRKAFPGQLHGLYAREEMAQDGRYVELDSDFDYKQNNEGDITVIKANVPETENKSQVTEEPVSESSEERGYTIAEIRGNGKTKEKVSELVALTGKTSKEVVVFLNTLNKDKKYTLFQIEELMNKK